MLKDKITGQLFNPSNNFTEQQMLKTGKYEKVNELEIKKEK